MRPVPPLAAVLGRLTLAELRKLSVSRLALAGLLFLFAMTALVVFVVDIVAVNSPPEAGTTDLPSALAVSLGFRDFYLAQIWLVVLTASSLAGEFSSRTLRDDVTNAVPRWGILLAKWVALGVWSAVALIGQTVIGSVVGLGALDSGGDWGSWFGAVAATLTTDMSFTAFAMLVAVLTRRVAPAVVATILIMGIERAVAFVLYIASNVDPAMIEGVLPGIPLADIAATVLPYMPASAWSIGTTIAFGSPVEGFAYAALGVWTTAFVASTAAIFERLDIP